MTSDDLRAEHEKMAEGKVEQLRNLVFNEVRRQLEIDGHCKSYEGRVSVVYPHYFQEPDDFAVTLDCYLIGPARHYEWRGKSIDDCCDKAIADVTKWISEAVEESSHDE